MLFQARRPQKASEVCYVKMRNGREPVATWHCGIKQKWKRGVNHTCLFGLYRDINVCACVYVHAYMCAFLVCTVHHVHTACAHKLTCNCLEVQPENMIHYSPVTHRAAHTQYCTHNHTSKCLNKLYWDVDDTQQYVENKNVSYSTLEVFNDCDEDHI